MNGTEQIINLKKEYIAYYEDVPVQKYAAMAIARDEDTIIRWRKGDLEFADAVQRAKASWVRKRVIGTKAEFALERLENEIFSPKAVISHQIDQYAETRAKLKDFLDDVGQVVPASNPEEALVGFMDNTTDEAYDIS